MSKPSEDREDIILTLEELVHDNPLFRLGKIMGHKGVYVGRKLAVFCFEDGLGIKVLKEDAEKIVKQNQDCRPFSPMGSQMNGWVVLTLDNAEDYKGHPLVLNAFILAGKENIVKK